MNSGIYINILLLLIFSFVVVRLLKDMRDSKENSNKLSIQSDPALWEKIKVEVLKKGYNSEHDFPDKYSKEYSSEMSESEMDKAAKFELALLKKRLLDKGLQEKRGGCFFVYKDENGKVHNTLCLSNDPDVNYKILMEYGSSSHAYKNTKKPSVVVLKTPDEQEVDTYYQKSINEASMSFLKIAVFILVLTLANNLSFLI